MTNERDQNQTRTVKLPSVNAPIKHFLGIRFDVFDLDSFVSLLIHVPTRCKFEYVVTPNVDHVIRISNDIRYFEIYRRAWLCVNDSRVLGILSRIAGDAIATVTGADVVCSLLTDARLERSVPLMIVGGHEGLVDDLKHRFGLVQVSQHRPPMKLLDDPGAIEAAVEAVEAADARFIFLAIGSPQQEILAATIRDRGKAHGLGLCVGASLDFLIGRQRRAPVWVRRMAMEWCFRLLSEPRRMWRRYLVTSPRIFAIFASDMLGRHCPKGEPGSDLGSAMSSASPTGYGALLDKGSDRFKA